MADNTLRNDKVEDAYRVTDEEVKRNENVSDRDLNKTNPDANPDPITGAPGSHPIGTGVGAAAAGAAGAAIGSVVPGVGTVVGGAVGAVVGAVAGGYAGKGVAEAINPTEETAYWRDEYRNRPYYDQNTPYTEYEPAYRYGVEARCRHGENCPQYDQVESDLGRDWESNRGSSNLSWDRAKHATRDAWHRTSDRIERATPGDSDRDGK
jgi:hypothetical protein